MYQYFIIAIVNKEFNFRRISNLDVQTGAWPDHGKYMYLLWIRPFFEIRIQNVNGPANTGVPLVNIHNTNTLNKYKASKF